MYHMILFTMFVPDLELREKIGWSCSCVIVLGLLFNMSQIVMAPVKKIKRTIKLRYARKKAQAALKLKNRFDVKNFAKRRDRSKLDA